MKLKIIPSLLLLALLVLPSSIVHAQDPVHDGDVVLFGQDYTLGEGETLNGDLAVFGGNIEIEEDAELNGSAAIFGGNFSIAEGAVINHDLAVFGGNLTISGEINGDIVIFGGQALLKEDAVVSGDIAIFGGQVTREPGAEVRGDITENAPPSVNIPNVPNAPDAPNPPNVRVNANPFWSAAGKLGQAVVIAAIAMLLALFLQPQLDRTANTIVRQPWAAGGFGLLTFIVLPIVLVIMTLTIILIPVVAVIVLLIPLAWLFGVIAIGQEVGDRFAKAINQVWAPVLSTGFGTFMLMLVVGFIELIPCVGWIPSTIVALLGIGATAMTWFGTRNPPGYTPPVIAEEVPPAS
jgi:hypothetical protein